ncbi:MAG: ribosome biogenesis GTPase Der [Janthinobacterium lividum]
MKIVILGRPNVGKSTLFNRLTHRQMAIVHNQPGVTRDWREADGKLADLSFQICDTAGLDGFESPEIKQQIAYQTQQLMEQADILLFMMDGREGITSSERTLALQIRASLKPYILLVNKCESRQGHANLYEAYRLGLGDPIRMSAEHGEGMDDLYQALVPHFKDELEAEELDLPPTKALRLAIVGRPNVGKSTLINALLGETRVLTGNQPGITRDAVTISWQYDQQEIQLIDTAGLRRRSRIQETLEKSSAHSSLIEIKYAHVVLLVLDASDPLNKQDLNIASHVVEEGRALVIAINKWDEADPKQLADITYKLGQSLAQVKGVPLIPISALKQKNLDNLMKSVLKMHKLWDFRIPTAQLNQWLQQALERHAPPLSGSTRVRIKYATQIKTRPPTFALFASKPVEIPDSYRRYLMTSLREAFDLPGVPLRFLIRKGKNPFVDAK